MMTEQIMKRGLSPEGRRNRQKHQGSLLNDEYGVTSQPVHKKIEKDFLKENVMRLKEIQAKCRIQESRPIFGSQPVRAIRPNTASSSIHWVTENHIPKAEIFKSKTREESAHSDYFSLSDVPQNEEAPTPQQAPYIASKHSFDRENIISNDETVLKDQVTQSLTGNIDKVKKPIMPENSNAVVPPPMFPGYYPLKTFKSDPNSKWMNSPKFSDFYPHSLSQSKIVNIIAKIKSKKPACDTSVDVIWKDIEKHHKTFFPEDISYSLSTTRTPFIINNNPINVKGTSIQRKMNAVRSQSLDRGSHYKANLKSIPLYNSAYTLLPNNKLQPDIIDLDQSLNGAQLSFPEKKYALDKPSSEIENDTLPNLTNYSFKSEQSDSPRTVSSQGTSVNSCESLHSTEKLKVDSKETNCDNNDAIAVSNQFIMPTKEEFVSLKETTSDIASGVGKPLEYSPVLNRKTTGAVQESFPSKSRAPLLRSKSSCNLHISGDPPPTYKRGQIPRYLKLRKAEARRRLEEAASVDPFCPPGHTPLPDPERRNTLQLLEKGQADVLQKLSSLPISQDTLRVRKLKQELEAKLKQIDEGIEIFSQPKVYVMNDE